MDKKQIEQLRQKFFDECTELPQRNSKGNFTRKVNLAPHDMFEWIKKNIIFEITFESFTEIHSDKMDIETHKKLHENGQ